MIGELLHSGMKSFKIYAEAKLGMEATDQVFNGLRSLRSNLFQTTRPLKPNSVGNRQTPVDHVRYFKEKMMQHKEWLERSQSPVSQRYLDACMSALTDAMIDLSRHQGPFVPASYHKGADPKAAEHLGQFAQFLHARINQPKVIHPILARASEEFESYIEDFNAVYNRLKESGELPEQV
jgi:hypothetical protein